MGWLRKEFVAVDIQLRKMSSTSNVLVEGLSLSTKVVPRGTNYWRRVVGM